MGMPQGRCHRCSWWPFCAPFTTKWLKRLFMRTIFAFERKLKIANVGC